MGTNDYKIVNIFNEKVEFKIIDEPHQAKGMPSRGLYFPEPNFGEIAKHYGLKPGSWKEKIVNLKKPKDLVDVNPLLSCDWVTPLDVKAFRQGKIKICPLVACGIVLTKDNYLIINLRGGELTEEGRNLYGRGFFGLIGGSVTWKEAYKNGPITDTIDNEFEGELGYFNHKPGKLIGVVDANGVLPGLKFISTIETDATFKQLDEANKKSNQLREELLGKGIGESEIKTELERKRLPVEAWESAMLIPIRNDKKAIENFINAQKNSFVGSASGGLMIYAQTLKGD